ncbi:hypothetical protein QAD02_009488 [Eretmocerus hayati]|uniref:Uncharacterized protein n=1 Tax=Eretmocerus hayati TaxID=131215 RepID=A0ACC2N9I0_9HYME|nr:hypothetical protein QAD02_009488 [Eretmocerus hayati]
MERFFLIRCRNELRIVLESWFESSDGARGTRRYWWPIDASSRDQERLARLGQHPERARLMDFEEILDSAERYDELQARLLLIAADYDTSDDDTMNDHCAQDSDDEFHDNRAAYGAGAGEASDLMLVDGDIWMMRMVSLQQQKAQKALMAGTRKVRTLFGAFSHGVVNYVMLILTCNGKISIMGDGDKDEPMPLVEERGIGLYEERLLLRVVGVFHTGEERWVT